MLASFQQYIEKNNLFNRQTKLLVGVSGGRDSMALTSLLEHAGYTFAVAHCNFNLRGAESDEEENFVLSYFSKKNIRVFNHQFQTKEYAAQQSCSLQMAARELRYSWFQKLLNEHSFDMLLTAHHANDNIETFFINLLRGAGLNGLKGIPVKSSNIARPLLFASRYQIDSYITQHAIPYRDDSSNGEEKYLRNKLRKQLIPLLKEINPSLEETMTREINILNQSHILLSESLHEKIKSITTYHSNTISISLPSIQDLDYRELILHEALREFGFNADSVLQINDCIHSEQSGKQFYSATHTLLVNRKELLIRSKNHQSKEETIVLADETTCIQYPIQLSLSKQEGAQIISSNFIASLDAEKITFPLYLTKWQEGDAFQPLGMKGFKKLSDFFVDQKMSLFEKQEQWILRSKEDIIWVVGRRVDNRFKVSDSTQKTLLIEWTK